LLYENCYKSELSRTTAFAKTTHQISGEYPSLAYEAEKPKKTAMKFILNCDMLVLVLAGKAGFQLVRLHM
jgi:hypothetical protein